MLLVPGFGSRSSGPVTLEVLSVTPLVGEAVAS